MFRPWVLSVLLACGTVAAAQNAPSNPANPTNSGNPGSPQAMPQPPGLPMQPQTNGDPTAVPSVPPTFAPGVGSGETSAPSNSNRTVRISGGVMAGMLVSKVDPVYPVSAKSAGVQGSVVLSARVGKDGHVQNLSTVSGPPELQAAAVDAVKQWVYKPYRLNGDPVEVLTTVTVNFNLTRSQ